MLDWRSCQIRYPLEIKLLYSTPSKLGFNPEVPGYRKWILDTLYYCILQQSAFNVLFSTATCTIKSEKTTKKLSSKLRRPARQFFLQA